MATQTALAITEIGKPLTKKEFPVPNELKDNELLVKISAAGLAPVDQKFRDLGFLNIGSRLPYIPSGDVVGTVVKGGASTVFPEGARVFSQAQFDIPAGGGLQEYTVLNSEYSAIVPSTVSDLEAALYPTNGVTCAMSLFSSAGFDLPFPGSSESAEFDYASQKVAILGGGTNIGRLAVQLLRLAGLGTIIAIASIARAAELKDLGATHVIDRHSAGIKGQVRQILGNELLYVLDTFSSRDYSLGASLLSNSKRGVLVALNHDGKAAEARLAAKKGVEVKHVIGLSQAIPEFGKLFWKQFPRWLEAGKVRLVKFNITEGLDAKEVNAALDKYRDGKGGDRYHVRI